jgi:hypothetical protein
MVKKVENQGISRKGIDELIWGVDWNKEHTRKWADKYKGIIDKARLAPSWANQQPWRFTLHNEHLVLCIKKESVGGHLSINMNKIDGGIVMLYFQLIAAHEGVRGIWKKASPSEIMNIDIADKHEVVSIFKPTGLFE